VSLILDWIAAGGAWGPSKLVNKKFTFLLGRNVCNVFQGLAPDLLRLDDDSDSTGVQRGLGGNAAARHKGTGY
jgi:hypothetical protein